MRDSIEAKVMSDLNTIDRGIDRMTDTIRRLTAERDALAAARALPPVDLSPAFEREYESWRANGVPTWGRNAALRFFMAGAAAAEALRPMNVIEIIKQSRGGRAERSAS